MPIQPNSPGGWRMDLERRDQLFAGAIEIDFNSLMKGFREPEEIDPRPWHKIENQGSVGSCQGHSLSSVVEHAYHIATGEVKQFSRAYAYYATQLIDGISGDEGSTIDGGVQLATIRGLPLEESWTYSGRYDPTPPGGWDAQYEAAAPWKIRNKVIIRNYDDAYRFLASGQGGIHHGSSWGFEPNREGVVERFRPGGGGHSTAFLGYSKRKNIWMANSWGNWGIGGYAEITPEAFNAMCRHSYSVVIGLTDLTTPKARRIDWATEDWT